MVLAMPLGGVVTGSVAERLSRPAVVTACVQAANVWAAGDADGGERWRRVAELHGLVSLAHLVHDGRPLPLVEFVDRLDGPLSGLLPEHLREECDGLALAGGRRAERGRR